MSRDANIAFSRISEMLRSFERVESIVEGDQEAVLEVHLNSQFNRSRHGNPNWMRPGIAPHKSSVTGIYKLKVLDLRVIFRWLDNRVEKVERFSCGIDSNVFTCKWENVGIASKIENDIRRNAPLLRSITFVSR